MSKLDPVIESDLNAIETALREGRPTATLSHERDLQELALLLESEGERPDPQFAAELADRVHDGFPRERRRRLPALRLPRLSRPLVAVAASAALALVVVVAVQSGDEDTSSPGSLAGGGGGSAETLESLPDPRSATGDAAGGAELAAPGTVTPEPPIGIPPIVPPNDGRFAPGRRERRIERSASLTLGAPGDELDRVGERIVSVTERYQGFVLSSSITSGDEGGEGGNFQLRIPADRLQPALRDLAALGEVKSRTQSGQDVTVQFVTAGDRLQSARAERKSLLRRLETADTDEEAEALRRRLDLNALEIRRLRGQLRTLSLRTNYAAVTVTLEQEDGSGSGGAGGSSSLDDALDDALDSLTDSIGIALRILGVAIPLGLLAAAAWAAARLLRRRRREAALS
jgi:Domain of unknown function (DUF4349)